MFKIGKKKESSEVAALNARLNARSPRRGEDDTSSLSADDSPTASRRSGSFIRRSDAPEYSPPSIAMPSSAEGSRQGEPQRRGRSSSILDRVRGRSSLEPGTVQQDGFLGVSGHGPTGFIGDGSLTLDSGELSGTTEDRRLPMESHRNGSAVTSFSTPPAPTLVVQKSSPEASELRRTLSANDSANGTYEGALTEDELSRGREGFLDRDATPRPVSAVSVSPRIPNDGPLAEAAPPDGLTALASAQPPADTTAPGPSESRSPLNASTTTRGSRPPSRTASVDGRSPDPRNRKLTISSLEHPPPVTRPRSKTKTRTGSAGSGGIAGALALSGVALASPHPGLAQPRVLRTPANLNSPPNSQTGHDDVPPSREVSESGHGDFHDGTGSDLHPNDYDVMMSMDSLGSFDDVIEQLGTGYAVASSKRNTDFHAIFDDVPDDDYLIEDYGCALQKEILVQGRLYVSEHHICFNSNIFGWVTTLVIPFSDVMTIEKRMTALIIPNAIQIATMHKRHTFASFLSRDSTYDLITNIWRISHPNVPVAVALPDEGVSVDPEVVDAAAASAAGGDEDDKKKSKSPKRKKTKGGVTVVEPSEPLPSSGSGTSGAAVEIQKGADGSAQTIKVVKAEHPSTKCKCGENDEHLKNVALDTTFPATPEKIYNLIYQSGFMRTFWTEDQKLTNLDFDDWKPGAGGAHLLKRTGSYIMPLNAPVGPKSTKCLVTDEHHHVDFDHYITNITTTNTPDVPSGGNFSTVTRTCITWAPRNSCRVLVTTQVEWTKVNRFLKSVIENSAVQGQVKFHQNLEAAIRTYIKAHRSEFDDGGPSGDAASGDAVSVTAGGGTEAALTHKVSDISGTTAGASTVGVGSATGGKSVVEPPSDKIIAGLADALGGVVELVTSQSPMMLAASALVFLLLIFNIWTLFSRRSGGVSQAQSTGHEVAMAVRDVLEHYFSSRGKMGGGMYGQYGGGGQAGTKAEVEEIARVLDALEERIAAVRAALGQVAAAGEAAGSA